MASAAARRHLRIGDIVVAEVQRLLARPFAASDTDRLYGSADWKRMALHMEMEQMDCQSPMGSRFSAGLVLIQFVERFLHSLKLNIAQILFPNPDIHTKSRIFGITKLSQWTLRKEADVFDVESFSSKKDCTVNDMDFRNNGDNLPVYNALDGLLKGSLERLKTMRESFCLGILSGAEYYTASQYSACVHILGALCVEGKLGAAWQMRESMMQSGIIPSVLCHNHLLSGLCRYGYLDMALHIFSSMVNDNIRPNRATCNILVHAFCRKGFLEDAWMLLRKIMNEDCNQVPPNIISSTIMMDGYFKNGDVIRAANLWSGISQQNNRIDVIAYNVLIHGLLLNGHPNLAMGSFCEMLKTGILPDTFTYNTLLGGLSKEGKFDEAGKLFAAMSSEGTVPDQISYKVLLQGLAIHGDLTTATRIIGNILKEPLGGDPLIWNYLIDCYGKCGDAKTAMTLKDEMLRFGVEPNVFTYNALIYAQVKGQNLAFAYSLLREMQFTGIEPDVVTYNMLIGGACDLNFVARALDLLNEMIRRGCEPDIITYTELIRGLCRRRDLASAQGVLAKVLLKSGLPFDDIPLQILVKRSCNLENSGEVLDLFEELVTSEE
ncbi:hypothetical protein MLD38_017035 [Melastoma candidum]|uniref:Uncharacterized protein n=2 Tax=Melastoma candidum TaxID=119954 RepID=A0ACB9QSF9_9MYRT|nr:hypothetical protein MLD38_017035 [Melastoma candidum]